MSSHPRIVIPILAVMMGGLSYIIFDPIRAFFVKAKLEGTFDVKKYKVMQWLSKETLGRLGIGSRGENGDGERTGIEKERRATEMELKAWLNEKPDTFITVQGPRGSGKSNLMKQVLKDRRWVVISVENF